MRATSGFASRALPPGRPAPVEAGEEIVGSYVNAGAPDDSVLVFTDAALYVCGAERVERIAWSDVDGVRFQGTKDPPGPVVIRSRGIDHPITITGTTGPQGKYKDAFSFGALVRTAIQLHRAQRR